jgi:hypothetical protein
MAILAGLASVLGRFAGRLLNTTLGWATILLFGKVPQRKQTLLLLIVLGSLGWVALVLGVLLPDIGALLIAAVPLPDFVDEGWIRLAMLAGALLLPLVVGAAAVFVSEAESRPTGQGLVKALLRGYPFTLVLAVTIVILASVGTFRKLRAMSRRWEDTHVPVIVKPGAYDRVLEDLRGVLERAGLEPGVKPAPRLVSAPPRLLDAVAGRGLGSLVPDQLMLITADGLEILVYPSDLAMSGTKKRVAAARAAIVSELLHAPAYLTTTAEAQEVEDAVAGLAEGRQPTVSALAQALPQLDARLSTLVVPFDEWETLFRKRLQVERDALRAGGSGSAQPAGSGEDKRGRPALSEWAVAAAGLGLVALDVLLLLRGRRAHRRG